MALTRSVDGRQVEMTARQEADFLRDQTVSLPPRRIAKSVVVQRLTDAGKIDAAYAALVANPSAFARWFMPGSTEINVDNAEAIALLEGIGADPAVILA